MSRDDFPILVVDDAKFSSAIIAKALRSGGFNNVRFTNNPLQALRSIEKRPAQLIIADWIMPSMDGVELTRRVKKLDESRDHYTHIILLTARDDLEAINSAFDAGVDDFLNKANLRAQLLARVIAARRISKRHNDLIRSNRLLRRKIRELQTTDVVDPVTGLGNVKFTIDRLNDTLKQGETRGGAVCLMLVGINNFSTIEEQYDQVVIDELFSGISSRIRQLVRPLDVVTRPEPNMFAIITMQPDLDACASQAFKRIFDSLYMRSFKTSEGYIPIVVGVSILAAAEETGFPTGKDMLQNAYAGLTQSFDSGTIQMRVYDPADVA